VIIAVENNEVVPGLPSSASGSCCTIR
jgi:hypothetical protein